MSESISEALVLRALWRESNADLRAQVAERRLLRIVAEWTEGSGVDITQATDGRGHLSMHILPVGEVSSEWRGDVIHALKPIGALATRTGRVVSGVTHAAAEIVRDPARTYAVVDDEESKSPRVVWPEARRDHQMIAFMLHETPGAYVRTVIAAASSLECRMLRDEALMTVDRAMIPDVDGYLGSMVRARTFVGVTGARGGINRLRATVRAWGRGLTMLAIDDPHLLQGPAKELLAGYARPEGWAAALLRIASAPEQPVAGLRSLHRPVQDRPIDSVPRRSPDSVPLGSALTVDGRRRRIDLPVTEFTRHMFVEGASGAGKTTYLTALVRGLSRAGFGFTLLEHHGTGVDWALGALDPTAADRAIVVRHGDASSPASLNIFDIEDEDEREQTQSDFIDLIQSIFDPRGEGIVGPRWRRWFSLLCDAIVARWGCEATLLHLVSVASDPERARALARSIRREHPDLAARVTAEIVELRGDEANNLPAWAVSKFQPLVGQRKMRQIIGRSRDSVDVTRAIDEGRPLLIDLAGPALGTGSARMLGAIWLLKHWTAMGRRADRSRPHVIIVDEAHLMTFGALPAMLAEARKFGVGVVIASQTIDALSLDLAQQIEANVNTHVTFRVGSLSAPRASARLAGWPAAELTRLPDLRAAVTLGTGGVRSEPFLLTVARPADDRSQAERVDARCATARTPVGEDSLPTDARIDAELREGLASARPNPVPPVRAKEPSFLEDWLSNPPTGDLQVTATGGTHDGH